MLMSLLLSLLIFMGSLILVLPNNTIDIEPWHLNKIQSELMLSQISAITNYQKKSYGDFTFNEQGHINKAGRLVIGEEELVLFLGMGKSEIRHRNDDD
ncbi:MAG: hypothetical protein ACK5G7_06130 [Erysipelotrichaceae bacterium]